MQRTFPIIIMFIVKPQLFVYSLQTEMEMVAETTLLKNLPQILVPVVIVMAVAAVEGAGIAPGI